MSPTVNQIVIQCGVRLRQRHEVFAKFVAEKQPAHRQCTGFQYGGFAAAVGAAEYEDVGLVGHHWLGKSEVELVDATEVFDVDGLKADAGGGRRHVEPGNDEWL